MPSKGEVFHVYNQMDEHLVIDWIEELVSLTSLLLNPFKHSFSGESRLLDQLEKKSSPSIVHYHDLNSAMRHRSYRHLRVPFGVDFENFVEPNRTKKHSATETRFLENQRWVLENARFIVVRDKHDIRRIEDWFVEQPIFGGGEFYYNYDNAQKVASKCYFQPYLLDEKRFDFQQVSRNKTLWMSAVHGVDLEYVYLSMSGENIDWLKVKDFFGDVQMGSDQLRFMIFTGTDSNKLRADLKRANLPGSKFVFITPQNIDLHCCLEMARAHIDFSGDNSKEERLLQTAQGLMGKYAIASGLEFEVNGISPHGRDQIRRLIQSEPELSNRMNIRKSIIDSNGIHSNLSSLNEVYRSVFEYAPV